MKIDDIVIPRIPTISEVKQNKLILVGKVVKVDNKRKTASIKWRTDKSRCMQIIEKKRLWVDTEENRNKKKLIMMSIQRLYGLIKDKNVQEG